MLMEHLNLLRKVYFQKNSLSFFLGKAIYARDSDGIFTRLHGGLG